MEIKLSNMRLNELTVSIVVVVVSAVLMLVHLLIRMCHKSCASDGSAPVALYYDASWCATYQHQYVVRLLHGAKSSTFNEERTTIMVELEHSMHKTVGIPFTPSTMARAVALGPHRAARVFIRTGAKYANIRSCVLHHDGVGSIVVAAVQVQHIHHPNALSALIAAPVFALAQQRNLTQYTFNREVQTQLEEDLKPTWTVTKIELWYVLYAVINLVYMLVSYGFQLQCSTVDASAAEECGFVTILAISGGAGVFAFLVLVGLVLPLRFLVRPYFHTQLGRGLAAVLRCLYLTMIIVGGLVAGVVCAEYSLRASTIVTQMNFSIAWLLCCVMAILLLLLLLGISMPLALWLKILYDPKCEQGGNKEQSIAHLMKQTYAWSSGRVEGKAMAAARQAKTRGEVRSVVEDTLASEVCHQSVGATTTTDHHTVTGQSGSKQNNVKSQPPNVHEDGYAAALAKGGNVRSISQFGGSSQSNKPKKNKQRQGVGGKQHQLENRKTSQGPTATADNGEEYYHTIVKVNKVKSVSHYVE